MKVLQPAERVVEAVLGAAVAEHAAGEGDFIVIDLQRLFAVGHGEGDLGHAHRLALVGAVENDVRHFVAAQGFGGSLTEHPSDGIDDIGLATAVGTDDAGDTRGELKVRLVSEGLEAVKRETLEVHGGSSW